jgi:polyphosphate glucokinase
MPTADSLQPGAKPNEPPAAETPSVQVLTIDIGGTNPAPPASGVPGNNSPGATTAAAPAEQPPGNITSEAEAAKSAPVTAGAAAAMGADAADTTPAEAKPVEPPARPVAPAAILAVDIGGTKVKILASGQTEPRKARTGKGFTPARLVETVRELALGWDYEAVSLGYPGLVGLHGPRSEPGNLGPGWVGFDFAAAFGKPVKMVNDAAMQALGSYEGGRMLFLGLGTGLGSALITGNVIVPLELGRLLYDGDRNLGEILGRRGLERLGKGAWRREVNKVMAALLGAFVVDYVVIGGGNAKHIKEPPPGARLGHNLTAFRGGFRLWSVEDAWVLAASGGESPQPTPQEALRLL